MEIIVNWLERIVDFTIFSESDKNNSDILFIPFEDFVLNPNPFIKMIAKRVNVNVDKKTRIEMKKQKVPRKIFSAGLKIPIYRKYGAKDLNYKDLEEERSVTSDYVKHLMKNDISFHRLIKISEKYNQWRKEYVEKLSF